jgi:D-alanyl-D-alanine carboxypeptidase/D-alanyl-D-alanine-endopeptidase (penicillin-binding protein 4)
MKQLLSILLTILSVTLFAQTTLQQQLDSFLKTNSLKNAGVSICVADANSGRVILSTQPQLCLVPASVQKLITSAVALEILGGDSRFETKVWANGNVFKGKLNGDLIITGGGDPTLGSENFVEKGEKKKFLSEWAHRIKAAGIDTITGNIVADPYIFADQDVPGSWLWEDLGNHYGAAANGISIYDNIFEIAFNVPATEGQPTQIMKIDPEITGLTLKNEVLSSVNKSDNACVFGSPYDAYRVVKGTLPVGSSNYLVKASVPDPALLLAAELKRVLTDSLVVVSGEIEKRKLLNPSMIDSGKIIFRWVSPTLSEIVEQMNKESNNLYAETLLKQIGTVKAGDGSTLAGTKAIVDFLTKNDIDSKSLFLEDGSGMSRKNAMTAQTLVELLLFMKTKSQWSDVYLKSIPLTGMDGTQKNYFQESFLKGKARAKTGSMSRVRSMAGYMFTQSGREVAFAIIINNFSNGSSVVKTQLEGFLENIYSNM